MKIFENSFQKPIYTRLHKRAFFDTLNMVRLFFEMSGKVGAMFEPFASALKKLDPCYSIQSTFF